jgi:hypothetical protein
MMFLVVAVVALPSDIGGMIMPFVIESDTSQQCESVMFSPLSKGKHDPSSVGLLFRVFAL